jgi:hypothetical protein
VNDMGLELAKKRSLHLFKMLSCNGLWAELRENIVTVAINSPEVGNNARDYVP